jgi:hypothetical protein
MVIFNYKSITKLHIINGLTSIISIMAIAGILGAAGYGILEGVHAAYPPKTAK